VRRLLAFLLVVACVVTLAVFGLGAGGDGDSYKVRAIFDNAGFAIPGMDVKISGVKVGKIDSLDVTKDKKAAMVLLITNKNFQDWRQDASCRIRPQSLIGEKFIECLPTQPREAGEQAPPPLREIKEGDGEGEFLLPSANTSGAVDLDLVGNINRLPYRQRFTIILNEFGVGLAGNGAALQRALKKTDPTFKALDDVLEILAKQNKTLAQLADNGDKALAPLAREKEHITGFIRNSGEAAQATAERSADFRADLQKFPAFLRELGPTMRALTGFNEAFLPVVQDLSRSASSLNTFVTGTPDFTDVSSSALTSLGTATESIGPSLQQSLPLVKDLGTLGKSTVPLTKNLGATLLSLRKEDGIDNLLRFIFRFAGSSNAYDEFGHYIRARLVLGTCQTYVTTPGNIACTANFNRDKGAVTTPPGPDPASIASAPSAGPAASAPSSEVKAAGAIKLPKALRSGARKQGAASGSGSARARDVQPLLDYLLGG
jgi:ABC-type transporter Mla subunit MlaD